MGGRQIVLISAAGFSVLNTGIFWREAKTKRLFHSVHGSADEENTEILVMGEGGGAGGVGIYSMIVALLQAR
jgi:hypothetical protein